ncbi:hypothetical protein EXN66_Car002462 [Xyrichtys novacula]|uniref:Uncharacterized protein n=1 Tax=Xyrichtys novacula TaxID=13765 RepID=A0AAV1ENB3_XYRNO|nr:hypothetical protein EXN66_Car002462 [Xyrichtys novacula]
MLLPMGMQAQSVSPPPPPPLPPPPSCSTQPRSPAARRPVASAMKRGDADERGLGFSGSPRGPESGKLARAQSDITASKHPKNLNIQTPERRRRRRCSIDRRRGGDEDRLVGLKPSLTSLHAAGFITLSRFEHSAVSSL